MSSSIEEYYASVANIPFRKREMVTYTAGGIGDSLLSGVVSTFFMIFATSVLNISPITIGTVLLATKFIDAFWDPVVGVMIDNTRTKYGKLRPYILFGGLFWSAMTFLLFIDPSFASEGIKIAYVATIYTLWGIGFSLFDVPYWSMSAIITTNPEKRHSIVSLTRSATTLGTIIVSLAGGLLVSYFAPFPHSGQGFSYVGWIFSILAVVSFIILFMVSKERVKPKPTKTSFKSIVHILKINKPLQAYLATQVLQVFAVLIPIITGYYAIFDLGGIALLSFIMVPTMIGFLVTPQLIPRLLKITETPKLFLYNGIASLIVGAAYYTVGYHNLTFVFIFSLLSGISISISMTLGTIYLVDSIDYAEWKLGYRSEGIMFAIQSLTAKIMSAVGSFVSGALLTIIGFSNTAPTQSASTLNGIFLVMAFGVGVSGVLGALPLLICKYKGQERKEILIDLANRANM